MTYFSSFLIVHSWMRWLVLLMLVLALVRAYQGWSLHKTMQKWDVKLIKGLLAILYVQLLMGYFLYFHSPAVNYFLNHFKESIHQTQLRFWGMEHITAMTFSVLLMSWGSFRAFRKPTDREKFKTLALWLTLGFLIIFLSIPWSFSPFTARADFRTFW